MKKLLSSRQICFILIAYNVCGKLLLFPNQLAYISGNDLLFAALLPIALQTAVVWAVSYLCSKTDKTFYQLLQSTFGAIVGKVIMGLFAAFFLLTALFGVLENKLYVHAVFYDTLPSLTVFLPFFIFAVYAGAKGLRNVGRCADLCLPVFALSLGILLALSFGEVRWRWLLPVLKTPVAQVGRGALATVHFFYEGAVMLMFMGNFTYRKGDCAKITLSYALGGVITLLFLAAFYGIFGQTSPLELYAVSRIAAYFPAIELIGRIDLLIQYALEVVTLFALVLPLQLCVESLTQCTGWQRRGWLSCGVCAILLALTVGLDNRFHGVNQFFTNWSWVICALFAVILPVCAWALRRKS